MSTFKTDDFFLVDYVDTSKTLSFDLAALAAGQYTTLSVPNVTSGAAYTGILALSNQQNTWLDNQTIANGVDFIIGDAGVSLSLDASDPSAFSVILAPGALTASRGATFPDITGEVLLTAGAQTITGVKTFDGATVGDAPIRILADPTAGAPMDCVLELEDVNSGGPYVIRFVIPTSGLTADATITLPTTTGSLMTATSIVTSMTNKAIMVGAEGVAAVSSFRDSAVSTKNLFIDLSGNASAIDGCLRTFFTADRNFDFADVTGQAVIVGNNATTSAANNLGEADHTTQSAAIGATNFTHTTAAVGMYQVNYYLECTTADAIEVDTVNFQISYTDDVGATTQTSANLGVAATTTGTTAVKGTFNFYVASGGVTYQTNISGSLGATAKYALRARILYLG